MSGGFESVSHSPSGTDGWVYRPVVHAACLTPNFSGKGLKKVKPIFGRRSRTVRRTASWGNALTVEVDVGVQRPNARLWTNAGMSSNPLENGSVGIKVNPIPESRDVTKFNHLWNEGLKFPQVAKLHEDRSQVRISNPTERRRAPRSIPAPLSTEI